MKTFILILLAFFSIVRSDTYHSVYPYYKGQKAFNERMIKTPGIVRVSIIDKKPTQNIIIKDRNGKAINRIMFNVGEDFVLLEKDASIRAYYPDYGIFIFDGFPLSDGVYQIFMGDSICFLEHVDGLTSFETWEKFLKKVIIATNNANPLKLYPYDKSEIVPISDIDQYIFKVIGLKDDWINVECDSICEGGCPNGKIIKGWLRWRKNGLFLVKLYYLC